MTGLERGRPVADARGSLEFGGKFQSMKKQLLLALLVLALAQLKASAQIITFDSEHQLDTKRSRIFARTRGLKNSTGDSFRQQEEGLNRLARNLCQLKEAEIVRWLGAKKNWRSSTFALPSFASGTYMLPGLESRDPQYQKYHVDFYPIDDFAGVKVFYGGDGVTPMQARIYFRVDNAFPALDKWSRLKARLAWDSEHFARLQRRLPSVLSRATE